MLRPHNPDGLRNEIVNGNHYYSHIVSDGKYYSPAIIITEPGIVMSIMTNAANGEAKWGLLQISKDLDKIYSKYYSNYSGCTTCKPLLVPIPIPKEQWLSEEFPI